MSRKPVSWSAALCSLVCCLTLWTAGPFEAQALVITAVDAAGNPLGVYTPLPGDWVLSPFDPDGGTEVVPAGVNGYEIRLAKNQWGATENSLQPVGIWGAGIALPLPNPSIPAAKGYRIDFTTQLRSWDSYNNGHIPPSPGGSTGFYDSFHLNMNSTGFFWNLVRGKCAFLSPAECDGSELIDPLTAPKLLVSPGVWTLLTGGLPNSGGLPLTVGGPTGPGMLPGTTWQWGGRDYAAGFFESLDGAYHLVFVHNDFVNGIVSSATVFLSVALDTATPPATDGQYPSWGAINAAAGTVPLPGDGTGPGSNPSNPVLPNAFGPNGSFLFTGLPVSNTSVTWIDPAVAIGYDYEVLLGPNFASVTLPAGIGDGSYTVAVYDTGTSSFGTPVVVAGGVAYTFPAGGVRRFRVMGIEKGAELDPTEPTAFVTGLTFVASGTVDMSMMPIVTIDHYLTYKTKSPTADICSSDSPKPGAACESEEDCGGTEDDAFCVPSKFPKGLRVTLSGALGPEPQVYDVKKPANLCTPAQKFSEPVIDEETHLRGYVIALTKGRCALDAPANPALGCTKEADCGGGRGSHFCVTQLKPQKRPDLQVVNQFHSSTTPLRVDAIKPDRLLVPTSKGLNGVPGTLPEPLTTDHYRCYKVALPKGSAKFEPIPNVAIDDQFITSVPKLFDLKKPSRLCIPVSKNGEKVNAPTVSLMCYQAVPAKGQPKHQPVKNLALGNQFGSELANTVKEEEFCVPSEVSESASPA